MSQLGGSFGGSDIRLGGAYVELGIKGDLDVQLKQQKDKLSSLGMSEDRVNRLLERQLAINKKISEVHARMAQNAKASPAAQALLLGAKSSATGMPSLQDAVGRVYSTHNDALRKAIEVEKARAKYAASPEGVRVLQAQVKLQKELNTAQKQAGWKETEAAIGRYEASVKSATNALEQYRGTSAAVFAAGTAAMMGFVGAASPMAMHTFTGSLEYLAIRLGKPLIPYLDAASLKLQQMARAFSALSPETQSMAAKVAVFTVGIAGLGMALGTLERNFMLMTAASKALQIAWAGLSNPNVLAIAGLTAALAGSAYVLSLNAEKARVFTDQLSKLEEIQRRLQSGGPLHTKEDIESLPGPARSYLHDAMSTGNQAYIQSVLKTLRSDALQQLRENPEDEIMKRVEQARGVVGQFEDKAGQPHLYERFEELKKKLDAMGVPREATEPGATSLSIAAAKMFGHENPSLSERVEAFFRLPRERALTQQAVVERLMQQKAMLPGGPPNAPAQINQAGQQAAAQPSPPGLLQSYAGMAKAAFMDFQAYHDRLQIAALEGGPLDRENQQEQLRNDLQRLLGETNDLLKSIATNSDSWRNILPPWRGNR